MASLKPRIKLTNQCRNNCGYCYDKENRNNTDMSEEMLWNTLDRIFEIYKYGDFKRIKFSLTGGDVFTSDLILTATEKIFSQFHGIDKYICADACATSDIDRLQAFADFGHPAIFLMGVNENPLDEVLVRAAIMKSQLYIFNVVLSEYNMSRMDEILYWVMKYKIPLRLEALYEPNPTKQYIQQITECVQYVYPKLRESDFRYHHFSRPFGQMDRFSPVSPSYCGYGKDHFYVKTDGFVTRCHNMNDPFSHINDPYMLLKLQAPTNQSACEPNCPAYDYCKGGCFYSNSKFDYCDFLRAVVKEVRQFFE